jgi:hypothetical protein
MYILGNSFVSENYGEERFVLKFCFPLLCPMLHLYTHPWTMRLLFVHGISCFWRACIYLVATGLLEHFRVALLLLLSIISQWYKRSRLACIKLILKQIVAA